MDRIQEAFENLVAAQVVLVTARKNGLPEAEITLAEMDRDKARAVFDEELEKVELYA